jgi:hypothetical protein
LQGKEEETNWKELMKSRSKFSHLIRKHSVFAMLVKSPETSAKTDIISIVPLSHVGWV